MDKLSGEAILSNGFVSLLKRGLLAKEGICSQFFLFQVDLVQKMSSLRESKLKVTRIASLVKNGRKSLVYQFPLPGATIYIHGIVNPNVTTILFQGGTVNGMSTPI